MRPRASVRVAESALSLLNEEGKCEGGPSRCAALSCFSSSSSSSSPSSPFLVPQFSLPFALFPSSQASSMPGSPPKPPRRRSGTPSTSAVEFARINALQIRWPGAIISGLVLLHLAVPAAVPLTNKFLHLQYCDSPRWYHNLGIGEPTGLCGKGPDDAYIVVLGVLLFTFVRASVMTYVYTPLGRLQGISRTKQLMRYAEQGWCFTFAATSWSCGMYLFYNSEYWLDIAAMYENWPETRLEPTFKLFYLMQIAFWLQNILTLNVEAKRKDYLQMFGHHILTTILLIGSYYHDTTRVGHAILTLMDFADIFLPFAKMLKYTGHQTLCDGGFGLFLLSWAVTRHYLLVKIIVVSQRVSAIHNSSGENITWIFTSLLSCLEFLICLWSIAILRVLWRILKGGNADDTRSDTELSDTETLADNDDVSLGRKGQELDGKSVLDEGVETATGDKLKGQ